MSAAVAQSTPALQSVVGAFRFASASIHSTMRSTYPPRGDHPAVASRDRLGETRATPRPRLPPRGGPAGGAASPGGSVGCRRRGPPPRRPRNAVRPPGRRARCRGAPAARRKGVGRPHAAPPPCPGRPPRRYGRTPARSSTASGAAWSGRRSGAAPWAARISCACPDPAARITAVACHAVSSLLCRSVCRLQATPCQSLSLS